ncbi:cytochrome b5-related protein-like [Prorops nasuta]|uniref:cytochrome b5-related protein-like n=1 Tax=Prorops nasuta TaxID=863751 RepID=UPI0034CD247D
MVQLTSTIPGLSDSPIVDESVKTCTGFLNGRRKQDGAEGLWRIRNGLYDLQDFARNHPGGEEWIRLTRGTDITEMFESHHLTNKAEKLLPKFYVRDAKTARSVAFTFEPDGFYSTFKKRALDALKDVDFHHSSAKSDFIADFLATTTFAFALLASATQSWIAVLIAGVCLTWTAIIAHNYFHSRDSFRMYYFDLILMSSKEWRISHVMSHHMYPNTIWDHEIRSFEPFVTWYPSKERKSKFMRILSQLYSPIIWNFLTLEQGIKRYYSAYYEYGYLEFRDIVPFFLPITMSLVAPSVVTALKTWLVIILISSFVFSLIGLNAAHHHPDIFHDGDIYRDNLDWGLLEMDAVRGRSVVDDNDFLVLTNFGSHVLHHLLPTVDHCYLPLCLPALYQTCKEFNISVEKFSQWEHCKGQFKQLLRTEPKKNVS